MTRSRVLRRLWFLGQIAGAGLLRWSLLKLALVAIVAVILLRQMPWQDEVVQADRSGVAGLEPDGMLIPNAEKIGQAYPNDDRATEFRPGVFTLLGNARIGWCLAALAAHLFIHLLAAIRWHRLVNGLLRPASFSRVLSWQLKSQFVGILPIGAIGFDAVRVQQSAATAHEVAPASSIVLIERLVGLLVLLMLAVAGLLSQAPEHRVWTAPIGGSFAVLLLALATLCLVRRCLNAPEAAGVSSASPRCGVARTSRLRSPRFSGIGPVDTAGAVPGQWSKVKHFLLDAAETMRDSIRRPQLLAWTAGVSLAVHAVTILQYVLIDRAINAGGNMALYLAVVPLVSLAMALPSLQGLFVFEGSMCGLLVGLGGFPFSNAIAVCAIARLVSTAYLLIPVAFAAWPRDRRLWAQWAEGPPQAGVRAEFFKLACTFRTREVAYSCHARLAAESASSSSGE